jgi:hypothetical protein
MSRAKEEETRNFFFGFSFHQLFSCPPTFHRLTQHTHTHTRNSGLGQFFWLFGFFFFFTTQWGRPWMMVSYFYFLLLKKLKKCPCNKVARGIWKKLKQNSHSLRRF